MSDFKTCLIKDSRLADITSEEHYAVMSGGSQVTQQQIQSTSQSTSSIVFQVQVPSENIVIDRNVLIQGTMNFTIRVNQQIAVPGGTAEIPQGDFAINYGVLDSFQNFPINSLFTTSSATINNTNVSVNTQDVLPALLRMNGNRDVYKYNGGTTTLPDQQYGEYYDAIGSINAPYGSYSNNSLDENFSPRGSWGNVSFAVTHYWTNGAGAQTNSSLVSLAGSGTGGAGYVAGSEYWVIAVTAQFTEPLLCLSPFIFGDPEYNQQGLLGINNMSFVFNLDSQCKRLWSTANMVNPASLYDPLLSNQATQFYPFIQSITLGTTAQPQCWVNTRLLLTYLSLQPSDVVNTKNVTPFMDFPRYLTTYNDLIPAWNRVSPSTIQTRQLTSTTIQLNQVPDLIMIFARFPIAQQNYAYATSFFPITNITINFNNQSGILSSATPNDLWKISIKNGVQSTWNEFQGYASVANNDTGKGTLVSTIGSLLVLSPAIDFGLPNYLSGGSLGNYNLNFTATFGNCYDIAVAPEVVVITVNSGIMTTQQGISNLYTGILTKEMVLHTNEMQSVDPVSKVEYERMVGGKMLNRPLTTIAKMIRKHHGKHGGSKSGGSDSGGAHHVLAHHALKSHGKGKLASLLR